MNKQKLNEKVRDSFYNISDFTEYAQHCEELLIEILPYLSIEGLKFVLSENKNILEQMEQYGFMNEK